MSTKGLYHDLIIDHYKNPRNFGMLENPDATAREANASCGDMVEFQIEVKKTENTRLSARQGKQKTMIEEIAWRGVGCAISTAAASLLSEQIQHSTFNIQHLLKMTSEDMIDLLGGDISHARIKCATLPLIALQKAINNLTI